MGTTTGTREAKQVAGWLQALGYRPDVLGPSLLALRVPTKQLEVPLVLQVDDIAFFDLYPFRFVPVEVGAVDWPALVQLATDTQLVKICVDLESGRDGAAPLFYSVQLPFEVLSQSLVGGVLQLLKRFAEERHDLVRRAARLDDHPAARAAKPRKKAGAGGRPRARRAPRR